MDGCRRRHALALALWFVAIVAARGDLVLQDNFSGKVPATNRLDDSGTMGGWPTTVAPGATAIIDDSAPGGLASTDALFVDTAGFTGVAGVFDLSGPPYDQVDMLLPGDAMELRFLFRVPVIGAGTNNIRFGILNNGGTQNTADNQGATATDTIGFGARVDVAPSAGNGSIAFLYDENTTGGGNMLGGTGLGTFGGAGGQPFISDTGAHEAVFRITRTATGYSFKMEIDGGTTFTAATNNFLPVTAFHQFGIISASGANDVILDNVEIDRNSLRNGTFERGQPLATDGMAADFARHWATNRSNVSRHAGLTSGSQTAAYIDADDAGQRGYLQQSPETQSSDWRFDVDFAAEDGGADGSRSFNLLLQHAGGGQLNMRLNGNGALEVFDNAVWRALTPTNFVSFSLDANNNNSFADPGDSNLVYHLTIIGEDYGLPTANYDVLLYALDSPGNLWSTNDLALWQTASATNAAVSGISTLRFTAEFGSTGDFAVDNVSLMVIPEPTVLTLLAFGAACMIGALRRRM